ncbi:unnamed protein product [Pleuronectes platessa]|uniref:Uncharacterized protein n=1 Tax=Pleuronectes platessa TaxID=8262 RepID=A0A9N7YNN6_PLEPL|nr:unnamed protein product [Pleuronectes platessa]
MVVQVSSAGDHMTPALSSSCSLGFTAPVCDPGAAWRDAVVLCPLVPLSLRESAALCCLCGAEGAAVRLTYGCSCYSLRFSNSHKLDGSNLTAATSTPPAQGLGKLTN